jgi:hypothetical protein
MAAGAAGEPVDVPPLTPRQLQRAIARKARVS